jgi:hypothetical protein
MEVRPVQARGAEAALPEGFDVRARDDGQLTVAIDEQVS